MSLGRRWQNMWRSSPRLRRYRTQRVQIQIRHGFQEHGFPHSISGREISPLLRGKDLRHPGLTRRFAACSEP